jgi:IstB-like ATP binding protein
MTASEHQLAAAPARPTLPAPPTTARPDPSGTKLAHLVRCRHGRRRVWVRGLAGATADFNSGTGKSRLLIALGLAACEQGRRVRYVITAQLVNGLYSTKRGG